MLTAGATTQDGAGSAHTAESPQTRQPPPEGAKEGEEEPHK